MNQISERVQEELNEASSHVRNALSFASRTEKPVVIRLIGEILISIENIAIVDQQFEAMDLLKNTLLKKIENDGDSATI